MVIWFIVLTTVMNNGDVFMQVRPVLKPEYNNEKSCEEAGALVVTEEQMKVGTNAGTVYFTCNNITQKQMNDANGAVDG